MLTTLLQQSVLEMPEHSAAGSAAPADLSSWYQVVRLLLHSAHGSLSSLDADDMNRPGREVAAPTPAAMKRRSAVARCAGRRCHPLQGGFLGECGRAENFNEGCCSFLPDRRIVVETRPAATEALRWFVSHMRMK